MDYLKFIIFVFTSHFLSKRARGHDGSLSVDNHAERSKDHFTQKEKNTLKFSSFILRIKCRLIFTVGKQSVFNLVLLVLRYMTINGNVTGLTGSLLNTAGNIWVQMRSTDLKMK